MELIPGRTLEQVLNEKPERRMKMEEVIPIFEKVAAALDFAHGQTPPILHRDIKPANIMVDEKDLVKVMDFGIACELHATMTRVTGRVSVGTLLYMSPQQVRGGKLSPASDVYSLAASVYECMAGHPPFHSGSVEYQIINETPPSLREIGLDIATHADEAILKALSKQPEERFASCRELMMAVGNNAPTSATSEPALRIASPAVPGATSPPLRLLCRRLRRENNGKRSHRRNLSGRTRSSRHRMLRALLRNTKRNCNDRRNSAIRKK